MTSHETSATRAAAPFTACAIRREAGSFPLLAHDMDAELGARWGALSLAEGSALLSGSGAADMRLVILALDEGDEDAGGTIRELVSRAAERDVAVILVAEEISPALVHHLIEAGVREVIPYPLASGALGEALARLPGLATEPAAPTLEPEPVCTIPTETAPQDDAAPDEAPQAPAAPAPRRAVSGGRNGTVMPVFGLAGGVGATTFAVNLAHELATIDTTTPPRVCLLDLDLQRGAVATYLDLVQRDAVMELLSNTDSMDDEGFLQSLLGAGDNLQVLTAPPDMLPLDLLTPADLERLIDMAAGNFDYVVIDMPATLVQWTETILNRAHVAFALIEIGMRSAQNAQRLIRALKAEDLPADKLRFLLNRAPGFTDLSGKSRVRRLAETLGIALDVMLPDGGHAVAEACDQGTPLAQAAKKNPLRREIRKLAATAHALDASKSAA